MGVIDMPINVHILHTHYPHWGAYSGFHQFVRHLDAKKYRVTLHRVSDSNADFPIRNRIIQNAVLKRLQRGNMKWYKLSDLTTEMRLLRRCLSSDPPDIIHYLDGEHSARYLPMLLKVFPNKKPGIAVTFHQPPGIIDDLIDRTVIGRIDVINVVSPDQAEYFSRFVDQNRIKLILMGIDVDFFQPETWILPSSKFRCITVGHYLRDFKLLRRICERLAPCRDIEFKVVSSHFKGLDKLPNVRVYKGVDDITLRKLYRQSSLLLLPMVHATANNALLEGIACGLPVVASALPGLKAYVPGGEALLVKENSVEGFTKAILQVVQNPEYCQQMAAAARQRALELDWRRVTPLFEAMYDELAHRS